MFRLCRYTTFQWIDELVVPNAAFVAGMIAMAHPPAPNVARGPGMARVFLSWMFSRSIPFQVFLTKRVKTVFRQPRHKIRNPTRPRNPYNMSEQSLTLVMNTDLLVVPPVKAETQVSGMSGASTVVTEVFSDDSSSSDDEHRRVSFGAIQVREYERVVGDHPDTRIGVPLSIGWGYIEHDMIPIEKYESERSSKGNLRMSSITRKNILHNVFGIPEEELRDAEKEVQKIKKGRERSNKQSNLGAKSESAILGLRRKTKSFLDMKTIVKSVAAMASYGVVSPYM